MNSNYIKILDKLSFTILDFKKSIDSTPQKINEDRKIHILLDDLLDKLDDATNLIKYFNQTAITGILKELPNGRYGIDNYEITCNTPLEVYSYEYDDWFLGRIEYSNRYYFCCDELDNPLLFSGMKVKIRI